MNEWTWVDPRVERVTVEQMTSYLLRRGWRLQPPSRPEALIFEGPMADDGRPLELFVPASERFRDYRLRITDQIGTLAMLENRWAVDVLNDILRGPPTNGAAQHVNQAEPAA